MTSQDLGQVAAILVQSTPPSNKEVIWGLKEEISPTIFSMRYFKWVETAWVEIKGAQGENGLIGEFRGVWNVPTAPYNFLDAVFHDPSGSSYISRVANNSNEPDFNDIAGLTTNWAMMARGGSGLIDGFPIKVASQMSDFPAPDPISNRIEITEPYYIKGLIDVQGVGFDFTTPNAKFITFDANSGFTTSLPNATNADDFIRLLSGGTIDGLLFLDFNSDSEFVATIIVGNANQPFNVKNAVFSNCTAIFLEDFLFGFIDNCAFFDTSGASIVSFGTFRTLQIKQCAARHLSGSPTSFSFLTLQTGEVLDRIRIESCNFNIVAGSPTITLNPAVIVQKGRFIMEKVLFTGAATPLSGINGNDLIADFEKCEGAGVINTNVQAAVFVENNATVTTPTGVGDYNVITATYTALSTNQKISLTNAATGEITYLSNLTSTYDISVGANVSGSTGVQVAIKLFVNGSPIDGRGKGTLNASGRVENVTFSTKAQLSDGDILQVRIANLTNTTNITVEDLQISISK